MRRSGAPSQRSFSGLLNLPSPKIPTNLLSHKTPIEKGSLGGGCPELSNSKNCIQPGVYGHNSNAGGGMITSEVKSSESSLKAPGQGPHLLLSGPVQLSSPSTQPVHLRKPQSPNRSPLLQLNRPAAVLRQPPPVGAKLVGQNPNQVSMPTNRSPVLWSSTSSKSPSEAKKPFSSNLAPAAAVDTTTTNSTTFRCLYNPNLLLFWFCPDQGC